MSISADLIASNLDTKIIGKKIMVFESIDSTHAHAKSIRLAGEPEGIVILARKQISGQGRMGRSWFSPEGGIWMSIIISPGLPIGEINKIGLLTALAGVEMLESYKINAGIKWPNDIVVSGRKIGGVLLEAQGGKGADPVERLIISIGINLNFSSDKTKAFAPNSISVFDILKDKININNACAMLISLIDRKLALLREHKWDKVYKEIKRHDILAGNRVKILLPDSREVKGICEGITNNGRLLVQHTGNRKEEEVSVGEITKVYYGSNEKK